MSGFSFKLTKTVEKKVLQDSSLRKASMFLFKDKWTIKTEYFSSPYRNFRPNFMQPNIY